MNEHQVLMLFAGQILGIAIAFLIVYVIKKVM